MNPSSLARDDDVMIATTTWNAVDIVDDFLEHHQRLGVRLILVTDYHSTDGTRERLSATRWRDLVEVRDLESLEADTSNDMLAWAKRTVGRGWCLFCDPDEFLVTPNMDVADLVSASEGGEIEPMKIPRRNVTGRRSAADADEQEMSPMDALNLRIDRPHKRTPADRTAPELDPPWIYTLIKGKILVRLEQAVSISPGDHNAVTERESSPIQPPDSYLLHYPFRSYRIFEQKVAQATEQQRVAGYELSTYHAWQYARWMVCRDREKLYDEYLAQFVPDNDVANLMREGIISSDTRVRDLRRC